MAKRLNKFPVTNSRGGKIAQEKWFDGSIWELSPDEVGAYKDIATCRRALYQLARRRGWKNVKTTIVNVGDHQGLVMQCRTLDPNFWADAKIERQSVNEQLWEDCEEQVHKFNPTKSLNDWYFIKDVCSLFDEMIESKVVSDNIDLPGNKETFRNNQWNPHTTDSNV